MTYGTQISPLDEPVDVFSLWIDACEEVNAPSSPQDGGIPQLPLGNIQAPRPFLRQAPVAPARVLDAKRRKVEARRGSTDADLILEGLAEERREDEESYSVHEEDSSAASSGEEILQPQLEKEETPTPARTGRLLRKTNWESSDDE